MLLILFENNGIMMNDSYIIILTGGRKKFAHAPPGDIGLQHKMSARKPPRPNLKHLDSPCGSRELFEIEGEEIPCVHLQNGIFIRLEDFNDLKMMMTTPFKKKLPIPEPSISLAIRAVWEGQSFVNIISFRGGNTERCAPYHERRIEAVQCKCFVIYILGYFSSFLFIFLLQN